MLKTIVDQQTGILVNAEIVEDAETMRERDYVKEWGQTTATTLRLCEPFQSKGRIVIIDSWFGSVRTAYALRTLQNTYCVANVK